jgi:uncharacterized membrane protein
VAVAQKTARPLLSQQIVPVEAVCCCGLGVAVGVYVVVFLCLTFALYDRLAMMAFDLGIFDQAVWLISQGQTPFVTVRGLHILADHFSLLLYLLAPLYWLWCSPKMLLLTQTVALALGALPLYALARDRTTSAPVALLFALVYLLYPTLQWSNTCEFHPDTFATPFLLGAFYCLTQRRWGWYFVTLILTALTKETAGITILCLGIYALFVHRRVGWLTMALGALAFVIAVETVRGFNDGTPSPYMWLYARYGDSPLAIVWYVLTHPISVAGDLNNEAHGEYFLQLLGPVMFLPLAAPEVFLIASPALMSNLLSGRPSMHDIESYYTALIIPFILAAAVIGYDRLQQRGGPFVRSALLANLVLWSLAGTLWGPLWRDSQTLYSTLTPAGAAEARSLLASIPREASVSAQMALVPQLSHRAHIYTFPNPFSRNACGGTLKARKEIESISGSQLPPETELNRAIKGANVDYIALCPSTNRFLLSTETFATCATAVLRHPSYGVIAIGRSALLLQRGFDHRRGLRLLEAQSGRRIGDDGDVPRAYWAWLARESAGTTVTTVELGPAHGSPIAPTVGTRSDIDVLTQHNDNARTGANLKEALLNTRNVNVRQFGKLFARRVDGHIYAQPLYVPGLNIPGRGIRNLLFVATMHNSVYAFDADDPGADLPLWHVNLGPSVPADDVQSISDIEFEVGILGTPVIDARTSTLYVVSKTKERTSFFSSDGRYEQRLHALDLSTGAEKSGGPVGIQATVPGRGDGGDTIRFDAKLENQRPALLLTKGTVYICWASHTGDGQYHGWVIAYDAATLRQKGACVVTPNGEKGGIWQSGQGPAADSSGSIFLATGNGSFDGNRGGRDLGNCIIKVTLEKNRLLVTDWFAPHNVMWLNAANMDLSSSGPLLIPDTPLLVNGCKSGLVYVLDRRHLGRVRPGEGPDAPQTLRVSAGHIHGAPVYWKSKNEGGLVYVWGAMDYLKAFQLRGDRLLPEPVSQNTIRAPDGKPGGILSLSAHGGTPGTGIVWASLPYQGDANHHVVPGVLRAFDASNVVRELWNSKQDAARDDVGSFAKFCPPTVANGKVYLATFSCQLLAYGLRGGSR